MGQPTSRTQQADERTQARLPINGLMSSLMPDAVQKAGLFSDGGRSGHFARTADDGEDVQEQLLTPLYRLNHGPGRAWIG